MAEITGIGDKREMAAQAAQIGIQMGKTNHRADGLEKENRLLERKNIILQARVDAMNEALLVAEQERKLEAKAQIRREETERTYRKTLFFGGFAIGVVTSGLVLTVAMLIKFIHG